MTIDGLSPDEAVAFEEEDIFGYYPVLLSDIEETFETGQYVISIECSDGSSQSQAFIRQAGMPPNSDVNEGCTPSFWKYHRACWCDSYEPDMLLSDVFTRLSAAPYDSIDDDDRKSDFDQDTLQDALRYRGGGELAGATRDMLRHATAALLNGCSSDVSYPVSDSLVIQLVNFVLDEQDIATIRNAYMLFAMWNEDAPCPIDAHCNRIDEPVLP